MFCVCCTCTNKHWLVYVEMFEICVDTVCDLLEDACITGLSVWVHIESGGLGGISTQNHVRAVTSRAEIGLVSPVIRRRGERGKRRKLEERKRLFHHHLPLHVHHNFISDTSRWMHNCAAVLLWSWLKLMEYLYADCRSLHFFSFPNSVLPPHCSTFLYITPFLALPL